MNLRKLALKLEGWNTISDVTRKLHIKRSSAYVYLSLLNKQGFVVQKVKRPRGTAYQISHLPTFQKHFGVYEDTEFVAPEIEFTNKKISAEQKIAFFLWKRKSGGTVRYYNESKKLLRKIKNWKNLYRYIKAYNIANEFKKLYVDARKTLAKVPRMPKRYQKLLGVSNES